MVIFITEFTILDTFMKQGKLVSGMEEFQKNFARPLFTVIFRPKIVFSGTDSIFRVRVMHDPVKLSKFEKGKKSKCLSDF